jgi:hypothetical protein
VRDCSGKMATSVPSAAAAQTVAPNPVFGHSQQLYWQEQHGLRPPQPIDLPQPPVQLVPAHENAAHRIGPVCLALNNKPTAPHSAPRHFRSTLATYEE